MKSLKLYNEELEKFINQKVSVYTQHNKRFIGVLKAINPIHLNVVLMTDKEKILIKDISYIKRERRFDDENRKVYIPKRHNQM